MNDDCTFPNLFANRETRLAFARHSFVLSPDPQKVVEQRHNYDSSCEILWCLSHLKCEREGVVVGDEAPLWRSRASY